MREIAIRFTHHVGGRSKGEFCVKSKGDKLQGVIPEDFWPVVEWRGWGLSDGPELSERVMDERDGRPPGGSDVPASAQEVDLVVGVDASFQRERQMQVEQRRSEEHTSELQSL